MTTHSMPETDLARIRKWAAATFPDIPGVDLRIALKIDDRHVTVVELRPPWDNKESPEWVSEPVARLTYVVARKAWNLSIPSVGGRYTRYRLLPTGLLDHLLAEIDEDPTFIIWG